MIERAEVQFRQANDLYVKLKKQYDNSKSKADRLDKELSDREAAVADLQVC